MMSAKDARRLLLGGQGLLDDPGRRATTRAVLRTIESLGFVQVDSINVVERAHHLTLHSRLDGYAREQLPRLAEVDRSVFEHWTHDASLVPTRWFVHWKPRFARDRVRLRANAWWKRLLGKDADRTLAATLARITEEGPLRSQDFEHPSKRKAWWDWKPAKAALDFLWRTGDLMVPGREGFQKIYDLTERVLPAHHALPVPEREAHVDWACSAAAARLGVFTASELVRFWNAVQADEARAWCGAKARAGEIVPVLVASEGAMAPQKAFAVADWESRVARLPDAPDRTRLLGPFDPVVRDRSRCLRRFGFDYRFEAFVPEPKRTYGYFVMPILERDRIVGRADLKVHRARSSLEVKGLWWEAGVRATKERRRMLEEGLGRLAAFVGATRIEGLLSS